MENNALCDIISEFPRIGAAQIISNDELFTTSQELMEKNQYVYEELAK